MAFAVAHQLRGDLATAVSVLNQYAATVPVCTAPLSVSPPSPDLIL
jgi:hypothetical protein